MTPFTASRHDKEIHTTVLSTLAAEHTSGRGILAFFTTAEARALRLVNDEFREAVALFPWFDTKTIIKSRLGGWRACFPNALAANISSHRIFVDADFVHLKGIHTLYMGLCNQAGITDAAFANLKGIHTLDMSRCFQEGITDAAATRLPSRTRLLFTSRASTHSTLPAAARSRALALLTCQIFAR